MQINLYRVDYLLVGLTSSHCMKILPNSEGKNQQKVAVANQDGVLQLFSVKKENIQIHFKTLPGIEITSLQLAGAPGTISDKIFIASGNEIRGYNKKGKLFLSFNTNLTENIMCMYVIGSDLFVCGKHAYNHYRDCKDIGSYLCGDKIVDVIALYPDKSNRVMSILACEGRMLRVLEHSRVIHSIEIDSSPTVLHLYNDGIGNEILFGTVSGCIGILYLGRIQISHRIILNCSELKSAISSITSYDITNDENCELIIGRQDGSIEIYAGNLLDSAVDIILIYKSNINESITDIQCGVVGNQGYDEIIITTYTGRLFGLTTKLIEKNSSDNINQGYNFSQEMQSTINKLNSEIEELEQQVSKEREQYQISTQSTSDGLSAIPMLAIKDMMILDKNDAIYILTIEAQTAIDNVLFQSDVPLELFDVDKNSAVVSYSSCDHNMGNHLLATYRCQINVNRIEVKIQTIEGQSGTLQAYITPLIPPKCCQVNHYNIKPLSLHIRTLKYDLNRPLNTLTIKGIFSTAEIHTWLLNCIPEVPEKSAISEKTAYTFISTFTGTLLHCSYTKGEAEFKSDNLSTITILKDYLTKEATKKKIKLIISYEINEYSIKHTLLLIYPKLQNQLELHKQISLLNALDELNIHDEDVVKDLSDEYKSILNNKKTLRERFEKKSMLLDRLFGNYLYRWIRSAGLSPFITELEFAPKCYVK